MNKLLRILAEQTFYTGQWEGDGVYTGQLDLEKFAQLIVQECISMADDFEWDEGPRGLVDRMKQHFGVE